MILKTWYRNSLSCILLLFSLALVQCSPKKQDAESLFAERASGVVMIHNEFYYRITTPKGDTYYFSQPDEEGRIHNFTEHREVVRPVSVYGTGFFVSERGEILTNRHVICGQYLPHEMEKIVGEYLDEVLSMGNKIEEYYEDQERELIQDINYLLRIDSVDTQEVEELREKLSELRSSKIETTQTIAKLRATKRNLKIERINKIGIAYHNEEIKDTQDFSPCSVRSIAEEADVDLGLIQLTNKQTPQGHYIFDTQATRPYGELKIGEKLYMIGYNAGADLANTSQGIKAQITSGDISQQATERRLLYSIPLLGGSSGSPVMDEYGRLVAVNFARMRESDNFNFGLPWNAVKSFLDSQNSSSPRATSKPQEAKAKPQTIPTEELSLEDTEGLIHTYYKHLSYGNTLAALRVFSPIAIKRYHSLHNCSREEIGVQINNYLQKYKVFDWDILEMERLSPNKFRYTLELKLNKANNMPEVLVYKVQGEVVCVHQEGRLYIESINDYKNTFLRKELGDDV